MNIAVTVWDVHGSSFGQQVSIDHPVTECPTCHFTIQPTDAGIIAHSNGEWLEHYSRCTNRLCRHLIIAVYQIDQGRSQGPSGSPPYFCFVRSLPWKAVERQFAQSIMDTSPLFAVIYNQASSAEAQGLSDVAGPGYRKALEFLLKDYAIQLHPDDADWIRSAQLAQVIAKHFTDPRMSVVFSRATWLGNDQTHYERRWIDHDIDNLKRLIHLSVHFIEMERLASELPTAMPNPNQT
jgi:hypothetical protein